MKEFDYTVINEIYNEKSYDKSLYTSYLMKGKINKMELYFENIGIENDKLGNINQNVKIAAFVNEANLNNEVITNKPTYLIASQKTFWKMFKNYKNTDARKFLREKSKIYIEFMYMSKRKYKLLLLKEIK